MPTVLPFHRAVVDDPAFAGAAAEFTVHTRWIETEFANDIPPYAAPGRRGRRRTSPARGSPSRSAASGWRSPSRPACGPPGRRRPAAGRPAARRPGRARRGGRRRPRRPAGTLWSSPMQGTIVKIVAAEGQAVAAGDTIVVLEAMKMEQPLTAHKAGTVTGLTVEVGQTVTAGAVICELGE